MRKLAEAAARKLGLILIPEWRAVCLDEERHLRRLLAYLEIDCVFDVGANVGQYAETLRKYIGYKGQIISFEPNPAALGPLRQVATSDPLWHVEPIALGSKPGKADFHAYDISVLGSFNEFSGNTHAPVGMNAKTIAVDVETLSDYYKSAQKKFGFKRPFLKLDTQGYDLEVAKGADATLRLFRGVQTEVSFQSIYNSAPQFNESREYFEGKGFVLSRIIPIHEINFPDLVEMDAIFIRNDFSKSRAPSTPQ